MTLANEARVSTRIREVALMHQNQWQSSGDGQPDNCKLASGGADANRRPPTAVAMIKVALAAWQATGWALGQGVRVRPRAGLLQ